MKTTIYSGIIVVCVALIAHTLFVSEVLNGGETMKFFNKKVNRVLSVIQRLPRLQLSLRQKPPRQQRLQLSRLQLQRQQFRLQRQFRRKNLLTISHNGTQAILLRLTILIKPMNVQRLLSRMRTEICSKGFVWASSARADLSVRHSLHSL